MKLTRQWAVVACACLWLAASCGAAPGQTAPTGAATNAPALTTATPAATASPTATASSTRVAVAVIEMGDNFFDPALLTVKVGTTVTWKVVGQSTHDLAARDGSFVNKTMSFGQTLSFTFTRAGRYPYVCMQHEGDGMVGEVTVID